MDSSDLTDDTSIVDGEWLLRRIPPYHFVFDDNLGRVRPSTAAFDNDQDGSPMSVALESGVIADGRLPADVLRGHPGFALARITAGLARSKQQGIVRDPLENESAHALVFGKKTGSTKKAFANECEWVVHPPAD